MGTKLAIGGSSAYNPGSDPLSDGSTCLRDAAIMQRLGINAIRVYNLDPNIVHDECASIFNAVGIYMLLDVNSPLPNESLDRGAPWNSYNVAYLNRTFAVVEAFKGYPNTLLFFAGNEVISELASGGIVPPYVRVSRRMVLRTYLLQIVPPKRLRLLRGYDSDICEGSHKRLEELYIKTLHSPDRRWI